MIDTLIQLITPLSLVLALILLLHRPLLTHFGAQCVYVLWLAVPISLVSYLLPVAAFSSAGVINTPIEHFIVKSGVVMKQSLSQGSMIEWLAIGWLTVSTLFATYWLIQHLYHNAQLKLQVFEFNNDLVEVPQNLTIYQSAHAYSPMLIGLFKQKLVVPEHFTTIYNQEQQRLVLEHEICHFDRNDMYWNLIAFMFVTLFWFHPLVWLAYFRFRRDQELSCDQTVLARKQLTSRINYSKALLVTAETAPPIAFAQLTFKQYGDKEIMFERIKHIKTNVKTSKLGLALVSMLSIGVLSSMSYAGNLANANATAAKVSYEAKPVMRIEPKYPLVAIERQQSGAVILQFDINSNGDPENIKVIKSQPQGVFDDAAIAALEQWQYEQHNYGTIEQNLVQLDFLFDENAKKVHLLEAIEVGK